MAFPFRFVVISSGLHLPERTPRTIAYCQLFVKSIFVKLNAAFNRRNRSKLLRGELAQVQVRRIVSQADNDVDWLGRIEMLFDL